jgi:hypothetical protein
VTFRVEGEVCAVYARVGREAWIVASRAKIGGKSLESGSLLGSIEPVAVIGAFCETSTAYWYAVRSVVKYK